MWIRFKIMPKSLYEKQNFLIPPPTFLFCRGNHSQIFQLFFSIYVHILNNMHKILLLDLLFQTLSSNFNHGRWGLSFCNCFIFKFVSLYLLLNFLMPFSRFSVQISDKLSILSSYSKLGWLPLGPAKQLPSWETLTFPFTSCWMSCFPGSTFSSFLVSSLAHSSVVETLHT